MDLSILLAKAMGLYLIITSLSVMINASKVKSLITGIMQNPPLQLIMGLNILVIGILLVLGHNIWVPSWPVVVTILAWIVLIKGIINVAFPQYANTLNKYFTRSKTSIYMSAHINLLIGLFLCYVGFVL